MIERTVRGDLCRYLDEYNWGWGLTHKVINWFHGTSYTIAELKKLYKTPEQESAPADARTWMFGL